jgi:alkylation response protein AidB-like acyl-CoA dehydrogenase
MGTMPATTDVSEERAAFVEAIRGFAARECGTREQRARLTDDWTRSHSGETYARLAELGWLGCCFPEAYGGSGGGIVDACLFLEEISRGQIPIHYVGVSMIVAKAVETFGTEEQKQDIIGGFLRGEVASIAMSEPGAGSDVGALSCRAVRRDGGYVVNGQKTWITGAHEAARILLVCRTDGSGPKHHGITMLDVPADTPGIEIRQIETMGGRDVNDLYFTDVFVPEERLVGREGEAWRQLMAGLNFERTVGAASILGIGERAFDEALAYVKEREQFGQPIGRFQVIKHRIADLATELECCRLLVYDVAGRADAEPDRVLAREAAMAKLKVTETAKRVALEGMQMMGGYGYSTEYDMERHVRETVVSTVYAGSSEIQREIIGKTYGL